MLALLAGIAAMHAGVFSVVSHEMGVAHAMGDGPASVMAVAHHDGAAPHSDEQPAPIHVSHSCEAFTLAATAFAIGLVLLGWISRPADDDRPLLPRTRREHRERPPPWTVPSLSQLSILRI
ncbi:hypothetical protein JMUB6875_02440 [Nocardia sp. JMUB6875]